MPALERAHRNRRGTQPIEVEVRTLDELEEALSTARKHPARQYASRGRAQSRGLLFASGKADSAGVFGRHHAGKCSRICRNRRGFHLCRRAHDSAQAVDMSLRVAPE